MRQVHDLSAAGATIARIYVSEKPKNRRPYRARTLVSVLYYGTRRLEQATRTNKEWVTGQRKFRTREELEVYIARKKAAVERFIRAREKETS